MTWTKARDLADMHGVSDTVRGAGKYLITDGTYAQQVNAYGISAFNNNGFTLGSGNAQFNALGYQYASWTFRKQPKFFDIVTYTGNGAGSQTINHSLGGTVGCIMVKKTSATGNWVVWHRGISGQDNLRLNTTDSASAFGAPDPIDVSGSTTNFTVGAGPTSDDNLNDSGATYVAYLFAHDAGGFGASGTDNVISCGSFTTDSSGTATINLGYEPQWILAKVAAGANGSWCIIDNMRGMTASGDDALLFPNTSGAETASGANFIIPTATGFNVLSGFGASRTVIYIAIRRPMKTPTTGTEVFGISARSGTGANTTVTGGSLPDDLAIIKNRGATQIPLWATRLTGTGYLNSSAQLGELTADATILQANPWDVMNGVKVGTTSAITNASSNTFVNYLFTRATGFFDIVCYTGTGVARTVNHNLGVAPELIFIRNRTSSANWLIYSSVFSAPLNNYLLLNSDGAKSTVSGTWKNPTSTTFGMDISFGSINQSGDNYVAYLFASIANVSKVGSYTGTGATQTINAGLASGARFVMIKRIDSTGDWFVWDTARGMVAGTDPRLAMNSTAAESNANWVYTASTGFQIVTTDASVNASGGSYIYLAIA
jgi:hypothetical protein